MQFILKLFKEIISALSKIYTKAEVDSVLETKLEVSEFEEAVETETSAMYEAYEEQVSGYEALDARSKALANIAKWRSYASAMQSMVDDEMATMIAEEFEKAAQKYLEDPEATEEWITSKDADGNVSSTCPYYNVAPTRPVIDFNVVKLYGIYNAESVFNIKTNVPVFLPNVTTCQYALLNASSFNSPFLLPNVVDTYMSLRNTSFNFPVYLPKSTQCGHILSLTKNFNSSVYAPVATNFSYSFQYATSFNQPLNLPKVVNCTYMLYGASSFNQPLNLPEANSLSYALGSTSSFNSTVIAPKATDVTHIFHSAPVYNQPIDFPAAISATAMCQMAYKFNSSISLPKATACSYLLHTARAFNQPLDLPKATNCSGMLTNATSFNNTISIPKATNCDNMLSGATSFNQSIELPSCTSASGAFNNTALTFDRIADILMSLPETTGGVISFVGTPGADDPEIDFDMEPAVVRARQRGWTVEF